MLEEAAAVSHCEVCHGPLDVPKAVEVGISAALDETVLAGKSVLDKAGSALH